MTIEQATAEFLAALNGAPGQLDAWLECNNENDVRLVMKGVLQAQRETSAKLLEMSSQELLLMAGEMTAQELLTVRAVMKNRATVVRREA